MSIIGKSLDREEDCASELETPAEAPDRVFICVQDSLSVLFQAFLAGAEPKARPRLQEGMDLMYLNMSSLQLSMERQKPQSLAQRPTSPALVVSISKLYISFVGICAELSRGFFQMWSGLQKSFYLTRVTLADVACRDFCGIHQDEYTDMFGPFRSCICTPKYTSLLRKLLLNCCVFQSGRPRNVPVESLPRRHWKI